MGKPKETNGIKKNGGEQTPLPARLKCFLIRNRSELLIFLFFFLVACFYTWPIIVNFARNLFGYPSDNMGTVWLFWWYKNAGALGYKASFCPMVGFPFGQGLNVITGEFIYEYGVRFLLLFFNEVVVTNLIIFTSFFLSGITMYYLVRHVTNSKPVSLIGGFAYTICVYHTFNSMFFPNLSMIQWMPLTILMLIRLIEKPDWKNTVFLWLSLLLTTGTSIHYGLYTVIFMFFFMAGYFIYTAVYLKKARKSGQAAPESMTYGSFRKVVMLMLAAVFATVIVIIPFFSVYLANENNTGGWVGMENTSSRRDLGNTMQGAAKAKDYFIPNPENFTLGKISGKHINQDDDPFYCPFWNSIYIGWTVIIFALITLFLLFRKKKPGSDNMDVGNSPSREHLEPSALESPVKRAVIWGLSAGGLAAFTFSLSPYIHIGNLEIPMPSLLFRYGTPWMRWYLRFGIMVAAGVMVIACFGIQHLIRNRPVRWQYLIAVLLLACIFCETTIIPPFRYFEAEDLPEIYQYVKELPKGSSLAIYPAMEQAIFYSQQYLFFQRMFEKPLMNGGFENSDGEALRRTVYNPFNPSVPSILSCLGITHVLYHAELFEGYEGTEPKEKEVTYLPESLKQIHMVESDVHYEDGYLFEVTAPPAPLVPFYTGYISPPHIDKGRTTVRLIAGIGTVRIENFAAKAVHADMELPIGNISAPHSLKIFIGEETVWEGDFDGDREEVVRLEDVEVPEEGISLVLVPSGPEIGIDPIEASFLGSPTAYLKLGDVVIEPRINQ